MKYYGKFTDEHDLITVAKGKNIATEELTKALDPSSGSSVDIRGSLLGSVAAGNTGFPTGGDVYTSLQNLDRLKFRIVTELPALADADTSTIYLLKSLKNIVTANVYHMWNPNLHYFDYEENTFKPLPEADFVDGEVYYTLTSDGFTEYMCMVGEGGVRSWEMIGATSIDLTPFATRTYVDGRFEAYTPTAQLTPVAKTGNFASLTGTPTTLAGYGIQDANISANGNTITLGTNSLSVRTESDTKIEGSLLTIGAQTMAPVMNVSYDGTSKSLKQTINGSTTDVVTATTLKNDMSLNLVENLALSTWEGTESITKVGDLTTGSIPLANVNDATNLKAIEAVTGIGFLKKNSDGWETANVDLSSTQSKITTTGILKGEGAGSISEAVAGTDYLAPVNAVDVQTGNYVAQVTQSTNGQITVTKGSLPTSLPASDTTSTYDPEGTAPVNGVAVNSAISAAVSPLAPKASPEFTGTPTAPTAEYSDNSTKIATTAFVKTAINEVLEASKALTYEGVVPSDEWTAGLTNHTKGDVFIVETAGTYVGVACLIGDMIICKTTGTTASNAHWNVVHTSISDATASEKGIMKLFTTTGQGTDGTMTQKAITDAIDAKPSVAFQAGTSEPDNHDIFWVDTTTSGQYKLKAYVGGAWVSISSYWS